MPAEKKYFERVAVIAHPQLDEAAQEAAQVAAYLNLHGIFSSQGYLQDEILYTGIKNKEYDLIIALGGEGFTVATLETYKTFFFPNKPRGKFAGMPITNPEYLTKRKAFIPLYFGIWAIVLAHLVMGLVSRA